jgi:hypothetical protein
MALFWRIWAAVAAVNLIVLTVFVALAGLQFDGIYSGLVGDRLAVVATRTAAPFEQAARLGLGLASVRNADGLLERARQTDPAISAIHVFDPAGRIVHSTMATPPEGIPSAGVAARLRANGMPWHVATAGGFLSGMDITRHGRSAGGVLIVYAAAQERVRVGAITAELILSALGVLLGSLAIGAAMLRIGMRHQIRAFDAIERTVGNFEREAWRIAAAGAPGAGASEGEAEMRRLLNEAEESYRAAGRALVHIAPPA